MNEQHKEVVGSTTEFTVLSSTRVVIFSPRLHRCHNTPNTPVA